MHTYPKGTVEDIRRLERICLERAELCKLEDTRAAYRTLAGNYRVAAAQLENRNAFADTMQTQPFRRFARFAVIT
jgi:hypothetical protein